MDDSMGKPRTGRDAVLIGIVTSFIVVIIGGCGLIYNQLSEAFQFGDSGAGMAFWFLLCPVISVLTPLSIVFGSLIGYLSFRLSNKLRLRRNRLFSAIGGIMSGIILVLAASIIFNMLVNKSFNKLVNKPVGECPPLPDRAVSCLKLEGRGGVEDMALSPNADRLAGASSYNAVYVWDVSTGNMNLMIEPEDNAYEVHSVEWSPDGKSLAAGLNNKQVIRYDSTSGAQLLPLDGHDGSICDLSWSTDGTKLASASYSDEAFVWNMETGKPFIDIRGKKYAEVDCPIALSYDAKRVAIRYQNHLVKIWDIEAKQTITILEGHSLYVLDLAWSPDGSLLATTYRDGSIVIWDTDIWQPVQTLTGHADRVVSVAWSPDASRLASSSDDQNIIIWDAQTGLRILTLKGNPYSQESRVFWTQDTERIVSTWAYTVIIWDVSVQP
jgi:WD40 repeat protein